MAGNDRDDPYIPTPEEFAAQQRAKREQASSNIVVKVFRMMNAEIGRVKHVFSHGSSEPTGQTPGEPKLVTKAAPTEEADPLVAEQEEAGSTAQQHALPSDIPPWSVAEFDSGNTATQPVDAAMVEKEDLALPSEPPALPNAESPKTKRSVNISPDVMRRRGDDVARPN